MTREIRMLAVVACSLSLAGTSFAAAELFKLCELDFFKFCGSPCHPAMDEQGNVGIIQDAFLPNNGTKCGGSQGLSLCDDQQDYQCGFFPAGKQFTVYEDCSLDAKVIGQTKPSPANLVVTNKGCIPLGQ